MRETHEHVGARHLPCAQCRMPVWHRDHTHQAPVEMQIDTNLEDRRDTRDPHQMGRALMYQKYWMEMRDLSVHEPKWGLSRVADFLPYMDLAKVPEDFEYYWDPTDDYNDPHPRDPCGVPPFEPIYELEWLGPLKGRQYTIFLDNGKRQ